MSSLLSKIKKIKKLSSFTGLSPENPLPLKLWIDLLANIRKEIEEMPGIDSSIAFELSKSCWRSLNLMNIKYFPNVKKVSLPKWGVDGDLDEYDSFLLAKRTFIRYVGSMRRVKSLEMSLNKFNYNNGKWVLEKLNGMGRLLNRLETVGLTVKTDISNIQELLEYQNILAHLTSVRIEGTFGPIFGSILQLCKSISSLSVDFLRFVDDKGSEFLAFLASLKDFTELRQLDFAWPGAVASFCRHFRPSTSLCCLKLRFNARFFEDTSFAGGICWEDMEGLDALEVRISNGKADGMIVVREFMTLILKKVSKLRSLNIWMLTSLSGGQTHEPFFVEQVPDLHDSLESFELSMHDWCGGGTLQFDWNMMRALRNLKVLKLGGGEALYENLKEAGFQLKETERDGYRLVEFSVGSIKCEFEFELEKEDEDENGDGDEDKDEDEDRNLSF